MILLPSTVLGQAELDLDTLERARYEWIKNEAALIEANVGLKTFTIDPAEAYGVTLDGGGEIRYYYGDGDLLKIEEECFPSYGRTFTQYYFHNDTIMLIRDREDLHPWLPDSSALDPTRLIKQFEAAYYIWTVDVSIAREQFGVRLLSEGPCGNLEWEPTVQQLLGTDPTKK